MRWLRCAVVIPTVLLLSCITTSQRASTPDHLYASISFDIAYVGSSTPEQSALNQFRRSLEDQSICDGSDVTFSIRSAKRLGQNRIWNVTMLHLFERMNNGHRSRSETERNLCVFVGYVHGSFLPPPNPGRVVCGYTYGATSFAALVDHFDRSSQESALLLHEFGHVMDLAGDDHCDDASCVMYEFVRKDGARFCTRCVVRINQLRRR